MAIDVLKYNKVGKSQAVTQPVSKSVVGLDRDGIINEIPLKGFVKNKDDLVIIPGALEAIKMIRDKGYAVSIISDQPYIAKGAITQFDVDAVNQYLMEIFGQAGIMSIQGLYYNTSDQKEDIYAKPNTGMFKRCENEIPSVKFSKGWYVGDSIVDLKAALKIGAKPVLIRTGNGANTEQALEKFAHQELKKKARIYSSLLEFANELE